MSAVSAALAENPEALRGEWARQTQPAARRVNVELGCGMGLYISQAAAAAPDELFVGVERNQNVIIRALERAAGLPNVLFVCRDAAALGRWFAPGEAHGLLLFFPDPWPRPGDEKRRLTSPAFADTYASILPEGGSLELRTDSLALCRYSARVLETRGFTLPEGARRDGGIYTEYEQKYRRQGREIYILTAVRHTKGAGL
jgi:tRNA (guanine-N7-)-methyltransferase